MITVGINAHLLSGQAGYRRAGIHQYIAQSLLNLPPADDLQYHVYSGPNSRLDTGPNFNWHNSRFATDNPMVRISWEQARWPLHIRQQRLDIIHSMAFVTPFVNSVPSIVTVFDLSFFHYPERYSTFKRAYLQSQTRRSCRAASQIVTISESGRQDVHRLFDIPLERISVIYPGVVKRYRPLQSDPISPTSQAAEFKRRQGVGDYILHVGTLQPRKNIPVLIEAFGRLSNHPELTLVLVGGKGWLFDDIFARVKQLGLEKRVHFAGYANDDDLLLWYQCARMLVFPSIYEGFGMPIVEAQACGVPVIAANTSSIPEASGPAGLLFPPTDPDALATTMKNVLENSDIAAKMAVDGPKHAQQFSWTNAGKQLAAIYRSVSLRTKTA